MTRRDRWTLVAALPLALLVGGCPTPSGPEPAAAPPGQPADGGEAARTRAMAERASEMDQMAREGMDPDASEAEKLRAYEEFERERQRLNAEAEGRAAPADEEEPADP